MSCLEILRAWLALALSVRKAAKTHQECLFSGVVQVGATSALAAGRAAANDAAAAKMIVDVTTPSILEFFRQNRQSQGTKRFQATPGQYIDMDFLTYTGCTTPHRFLARNLEIRLERSASADAQSTVHFPGGQPRRGNIEDHIAGANLPRPATIQRGPRPSCWCGYFARFTRNCPQHSFEPRSTSTSPSLHPSLHTPDTPSRHNDPSSRNPQPTTPTPPDDSIRLPEPGPHSQPAAPPDMTNGALDQINHPQQLHPATLHTHA